MKRAGEILAGIIGEGTQLLVLLVIGAVVLWGAVNLLAEVPVIFFILLGIGVWWGFGVYQLNKEKEQKQLEKQKLADQKKKEEIKKEKEAKIEEEKEAKIEEEKYKREERKRELLNREIDREARIDGLKYDVSIAKNNLQKIKDEITDRAGYLSFLIEKQSSLLEFNNFLEQEMVSIEPTDNDVLTRYNALIKLTTEEIKKYE